jgi:hypothetical protein
MKNKSSDPTARTRNKIVFRFWLIKADYFIFEPRNKDRFGTPLDGKGTHSLSLDQDDLVPIRNK